MMAQKSSPAGLVLILVSALSFLAVCWFAWEGRLGLPAVGLLGVSAAAFFFGRRMLAPTARKAVTTIAKVLFTFAGIMALLRHPIPIEGDRELPIYLAITEYIDQVDRSTFIMYAVIAMVIKFIGVLSSAYAWHLLLRTGILKALL